MKQSSFKGKQSFIGTLEQQTFQKTLEKENAKQRIQLVRMQEATISRNQINSLKQEQERAEEERQQQLKLEEYKRTQQLIQMLQSQKEKSLEETGLAQKRAIQAQIDKEEKLKLEKQKQIELKNKQKEWIKSAVDWKNKENYEKQGKFKDFVQNKLNIRKEEDQIAKNIVEKYREELANRPEEEIQDPLNYELFNKNVSKKQYCKTIEYYANSHHHNPFVVKHLQEEQEDARVLADIEMQINQNTQKQKLAEKQNQEKIQIQRGNEAMEKIKSEKVKQEFEKEMEKLQNLEKKERIEQGKANPDHNTKPLSHYSKQFRKQEDLEKAFEKQFLDDKACWDDNQEIKEPQILKNNMIEKQKNQGKLSQKNALKEQQEQTEKHMKSDQKKETSVGRPSDKLILKTQIEKKLSKSKSKGKKQKSPVKSAKQGNEQQNLDTEEEKERRNQLNKLESEQRKYEQAEQEQRKNEQLKLLKQQQILNQQKLEDSMTSESELNEEEQFQNKFSSSSQKYRDNYQNNQLSTDKSESQFQKSGQSKNPFEQEIPSHFNQIPQQQQQYDDESITSVSDVDNQQGQQSQQTNQQEDNIYSSEEKNFNQNSNQFARKSEFLTANQPDFESSTSSLKESSKEDIKSYIKQQEEFLKKLERDREQIKNKMQMDQQKLLRNLQEGYVDVSSSESEYQQSQNYTDQFLTEQKARIQQEKFLNSMGGDSNSGSRKIIHSTIGSDNKFKKKSQDIYNSSQRSQDFGQSVDYEQQIANSNSNQDRNQQNMYQTSTDSESDQKLHQYANQNRNMNYNNNDQRANQLVDQFLNAHKQQKSLNQGFQQSLNKYKPITEEEEQEESINMVGKQKQSDQQQQHEQFGSLERSSRFQNSNKNWKGSFGNSGKDNLTRAQKQQLFGNSRSPGSELSYSLSDADGSAEKTNNKNYKVISFGSSNKNKQLLQSSLQGYDGLIQEDYKGGTAKFGSSNKNYGSQNSRNQQRGNQFQSNNFSNDIQSENQQNSYEQTYEQQNNEELDESSKSNLDQSQGISLAEAFLKKKAALAKKHQEIQQQKQYQYQQAQNENKNDGKKLYGGRTKEEILAQRKKMMQRPGSAKNQQRNKTEQSQENKQKGDYMKSFHDPNKIIKAPPQELMDRLALGKKAEIKKEDYQALTNKNYDKLPEVRKRKEEELKKQEYQERQRKIKEMDKKLRNKF